MNTHSIEARLLTSDGALLATYARRPVMDGLAATIAIRPREQTTGGHVRIVAMTAHAMGSDRERCLAAGMDGYLSRPLDPSALFAAVEQDIDQGGIDMSIVDPKAFDEVALLERLGDDRELMADVIRLFLEDMPRRLTAIRDAVTQGNAEDLHAVAHAVKGAAANLSAGGLFAAAEALERVGVEGRMDLAEAASRRVSVAANHVMDMLGQPNDERTYAN